MQVLRLMAYELLVYYNRKKSDPLPFKTVASDLDNCR